MLGGAQSITRLLVARGARGVGNLAVPPFSNRARVLLPLAFPLSFIGHARIVFRLPLDFSLCHRARGAESKVKRMSRATDDKR